MNQRRLALSLSHSLLGDGGEWEGNVEFDPHQFVVCFLFFMVCCAKFLRSRILISVFTFSRDESCEF